MFVAPECQVNAGVPYLQVANANVGQGLGQGCVREIDTGLPRVNGDAQASLESRALAGAQVKTAYEFR